jgi:hypothetical protein
MTLSYYFISISLQSGEGNIFNGYFSVDNTNNIIQSFYNAIDITNNILITTLTTFANTTGTHNNTTSNNLFLNNKFPVGGTTISSIPNLDANYSATQWALWTDTSRSRLSYYSNDSWNDIPNTFINTFNIMQITDIGPFDTINIQLSHLSYNNIIQNLNIVKNVGTQGTREINNGDEFVITYQDDNTSVGTSVTNSVTYPGIASANWKINITVGEGANKQAAINYKLLSDSDYSNDNDNNHWLKLASIIAKNVDMTINTNTNRYAFTNKAGELITPTAANGLATDANNIYKYIAFDQCRELNNVPICDLAKANLVASAANMTITDDTLTAFRDSFNKAHFVHLLYFFQDVTINPSLKISIYANTTFSYKNYNSANPTTPFTPNNNALSDEPSHTVLIKYTKV